MSSFPCVVSEVPEGKLGTLGGRTGGLLCKPSAGQHMNASILAALAEVDLEAVGPGGVIGQMHYFFIAHVAAAGF